MMGNEKSQLRGLEIEDKATEITNFWSIYQAKVHETCSYFSLRSDGSVTIFKGGSANGPLWTTASPLEKFSNNLLKYRHPCIIHFKSAWQQRSVFHLATEYVQPLSHILSTLTPLQKCVGLNNILQALLFLHEQAGMSHNNICISAVYVTGDGQWKLGDLQYLCPYNELTQIYLKHGRIHRYDKGVDPNEDNHEVTTKVDQYAFAVLVDDVFSNHTDDDVPHLKDFKIYCKELVKHNDPGMRPKFSEIIQHNFFNHQFISIHKFLSLLPLKTEEEKRSFFSNILENIKSFDEETVAKQLGGPLLSRITMLDQTARRDVIPFIFSPKNENRPSEENAGVFSLDCFKQHIKPKIIQLFSVRDNQIRMLLLKHFAKFVNVFSHEELCSYVLPELLLGIKDTDDELVSATLVCLSELVPILGAETVIGGKRCKFFSDGRPKSKINTATVSSCHTKEHNNATKISLTSSQEIFANNNYENSFRNSISLLERPSPVGGESVENDNLVKDSIDNSEEDWSDWENKQQPILLLSENISQENKETIPNAFVSSSRIETKEKSLILQKAAIKAKQNLVDITELDIKNQRFDYVTNSKDEFDFFADMKPIIEKTAFVSVSEAKVAPNLSSKLNFVPDENEGWGDNWDE